MKKILIGGLIVILLILGVVIPMMYPNSTYAKIAREYIGFSIREIKTPEDFTFHDITIKGDLDYISVSDEYVKEKLGKIPNYDDSFYGKHSDIKWFSAPNAMPIQIFCTEIDNPINKPITSIVETDESMKISKTKINGEEVVETVEQNEDSYALGRMFVIDNKMYIIITYSKDKETAFKSLDEFCSLISW